MPIITLTARAERRAGNRHSSEGTSTLIIRATCQCHIKSVPTSARQCHISVPI
ncbi:unnamed protein product [Staurois parvus]|uniref:Uncharacterized protein n=1 Tax=Staurois parvus TaxID=386267 RepID=A0ABN9EZE6_9NEOB|nr:unnamed protein product [Staurois parvus]